MASKGGVLAVAGIVGVGALLAFTASAKASTKTTPINPENAQKCQAYKAERTIAANMAVQLKGSLIDIDAARIAAADAGDDAQYDALTQQRANIVASMNKFNNRVAELDGLIAKC